MKRRLLLCGAAVVLSAAALGWATSRALRSLPERLPPAGVEIERPLFTDRSGRPLTITFENRWNVHDQVAYHQVPEMLRQAFVLAEDKRFFAHRGGDWLARLHAAVQNLRAGRKVRGASTISEQVVRIIHPRPRTLWSRWLEHFEARSLEAQFSKVEILEFYLNQVPYARRRRGVAQAARTYFDRDLDTLSTKEMLALAVLVRSPSRLDLERGSKEIQLPLRRLAQRMFEAGLLDEPELEKLYRDSLLTLRPVAPVEAGHFVRRVDAGLSPSQRSHTVITTLEATLQSRAQRILDLAVTRLRSRQVNDGAVLVVDHQRDEILAWVSAGGLSEREGGHIDKVLTPRQPGSTLKPFVYAMALERGWTAATTIEDAPLSDAVGHGVHHYRNYSRHFYGPVRLREALGNSLNTPAVRAVRYVGHDSLLKRLRRLGFTSLGSNPDFYGDGLALGNGEVTLFELVGAYATLARAGVSRPLRGAFGGDLVAPRETQVFDPEVSSLIAHMLADREARHLEFGRDSLLHLPIQTAVKTGTSNDYRDAWAVGFSNRHTVGVWMGNIDRREMHEVSGALGPALVLRALFAELARQADSQPLYLSRRLVKHRVCEASGVRPTPACPITEEWFRSSHAPRAQCTEHAGSRSAAAPPQGIQLARIGSPTPGLHLALDPRIPDELEAYPFRLESDQGVVQVAWILDGERLKSTAGGQHLWLPERGEHSLRAEVWMEDEAQPRQTQMVSFLVH